MASRRSFLPSALACVLATVTPLTATAADAAPTAEARQHFRRGLELLKTRDYEGALRELQTANSLSPKWTLLVSIGIASEGLERDGEAIAAYQGYLDAGGAAIAGDERETIRATIDRLRAGAAVVTLEAPGPFSIVDSRADAAAAIRNEYGPFDSRVELHVRPGEHQVELHRARIEAPAWTVLLRPGDAAAHRFEPDLPSPPADPETASVALEPETDPLVHPPSHVPSYVLWGTGALGAMATTVLALEASSVQRAENRDFTRRCPAGITGMIPCQETNDGDREAARWRTAALATGIGTLGVLITGTVLYFAAGPDDASAVKSEASITPWVSTSGAGVSGTF